MDGLVGSGGAKGSIGAPGVCAISPEYQAWISALNNWTAQWNAHVANGGLLPCQQWTAAVTEVDVFLTDLSQWLSTLLSMAKASYQADFAAQQAQFMQMYNASVAVAEAQRAAVFAQLQDIQDQLNAALHP